MYRVLIAAVSRVCEDRITLGRRCRRAQRLADVFGLAVLRVTVSLDFRESSPFALHVLKRAQHGWQGVTNSATALQQRTVLSAAAVASSRITLAGRTTKGETNV